MFRICFTSAFNFCKNIIEKQPSLHQQNSMVKLSKWISMKSVCSRKQAEEIIKLGLVRIDGKRVYNNLMVPQSAAVKAFTPNGTHFEQPTTKLWMINKPRGYICSHNDPQKRPTVYSLLPPIFKTLGHIISVGRLDYNSEGLLLLTNDVKLKNLLENPKSDLTRLYRVKVHGRVSPHKLQQMSKPIVIKGQVYGPLQVTVDRSLTTNVWLNVGIKTGKNRQIRRIMQKCDLQVNKLIRLQYGKYKLNNLELGAIMQLPISQGLQRKIKLQKAKQLSRNQPCLIQVDIREKAIQIATNQLKKRIEHEKQQQLESKKGKNKPNHSHHHPEILQELQDEAQSTEDSSKSTSEETSSSSDDS